MSPTLRSNTTSPGRTGIKTTPTKSPRKVPHCTKCQRPRAGHPRQGCPFNESPHSGIQPTLDITQSMDSLVISPTKNNPHERQRRQPAHEMTLASLSTESSGILNRLLQPEDTRDHGTGEGKVGTRVPISEFHQTPDTSSKVASKGG
jgi:hypothetical protein